jgi:hypothetical protein
MKLNFTIPTNWNQLSLWQLQKIAKIIFSDSDKEKTSFLMVSYLFIGKPTLKNIFKYCWLLMQVPFSELKEYASFLYNETDLTKFPKKIKTLYGPADRLSNLTIDEFTYADLFYHNWSTSRTSQDLNRLVAVLYRPKRNAQHLDIRKPFVKEELSQHASIVEKLPKAIKLTIAMAFQGSREKIIGRYQYVFKKGSGKGSYAPFTKIINAMSRSENQPFGDFYKTKEANIYDFFDVLDEELKTQKERERNATKNK